MLKPILLILAFGGCPLFTWLLPAQVEEPLASSQPILVDEATYQGIIFPSDALPLDTFMWFSVDAQATWTPDLADVAAFEAGLADYLQAVDDARFYYHAPIWEHLSEYTRQYMGVVVEGEDILLVNLFCSAHNDWRTTIIVVEDGGDCYWQVQYHPQTGDYFDLYVNGDA